MAAVRVLVDTDILIDYFNTGAHGGLLGDPRSRIYYSVVTRKELLAKKGLSSAERGAIAEALRRFRLVPLGSAIAGRYWSLRRRYPDLEKEDALIAATALVKKLPRADGAGLDVAFPFIMAGFDRHAPRPPGTRLARATSGMRSHARIGRPLGQERVLG